MKNSLGDAQRLMHMLDCCNEIELAIKTLNETLFIDNHIVRIAVVKWIEIIGEASVYLSADLKLKYSEINWAEIKGLRNIVVHEYFGIKFDLIWEVASEHIPILKEQIQVILKEIA
jgi:uncharacterized protein with HEPN domain